MTKKPTTAKAKVTKPKAPKAAAAPKSVAAPANRQVAVGDRVVFVDAGNTVWSAIVDEVYRDGLRDFVTLILPPLPGTVAPQRATHVQYSAVAVPHSWSWA